MTPLVRVTRITKQFPKTRAVDDVSFELAAGDAEQAALPGPPVPEHTDG